jgi:hypothetical protein
MKRRDFLQAAIASCTLLRAAEPEVVIERDTPGKPHAGKVLAAIQPHADDLPIFAGGTVASGQAAGRGLHRLHDPHD